MAIDAVEAPSPPSHPPSYFGQQRHFYVAVDRLQFKMETLVDLLGVAGRRPGLPMVVCCSSRDELDAVCSTVSNLPYISFAPLYSDLAESERAIVLEKFRQATTNWSQNVSVQSGDDSESGKDEQKSHMVIVTDVCLPHLSSGESPISARVLINYELPTKKFFTLDLPVGRIIAKGYSIMKIGSLSQETYMRRTASCLAADGIVINMVVGGEVVILKHIEDSSSLVIAEMPINISEIL